MDEQSKERIAKNEALFRDVNERVREIDERQAFQPEDGYSDYLCECGDAQCMAKLPLTPAEYEQVRAQPTQFVLLHGHERPEVERVVWSTDRFVVAQKVVGEKQVALETDPRA